jgi:hypothetical protein
LLGKFTVAHLGLGASFCLHENNPSFYCEHFQANSQHCCDSSVPGFECVCGKFSLLLVLDFACVKICREDVTILAVLSNRNRKKHTLDTALLLPEESCTMLDSPPMPPALSICELTL